MKNKKDKCEECNKHKATNECEECGRGYCGWCAREQDYQCYWCDHPPQIIPIK